MPAWQITALATALTAIRVAVQHVRAGGTLSDTSGDVSRIILAGTLVSFGATLAERGNPQIARQFAAVILTTSALVNGVWLADTSTQLVTGDTEPEAEPAPTTNGDQPE